MTLCIWRYINEKNYIYIYNKHLEFKALKIHSKQRIYFFFLYFIFYLFYSHEVKGLTAAYMTKENVNKKTKKHSSNKQKAQEKA